MITFDILGKHLILYINGIFVRDCVYRDRYKIASFGNFWQLVLVLGFWGRYGMMVPVAGCIVRELCAKIDVPKSVRTNEKGGL